MRKRGSWAGSCRIMDRKCSALTDLGRILRSQKYQFAAITPATHCRVLNHLQGPTTLRSVFGWNCSFQRDAVQERIFNLLAEADALEVSGGLCRSKVRCATIGDLLFVHSGFPTTERDAVFFGPDTYRFARLLSAGVAGMPADRPLRLIDVGSGSGAGGIYAAHVLAGQTELVLTDINPKALTFSAVNAVVNDRTGVQTLLSDVLEKIEGEADLIIANPPYLMDDERRLYRHGGGRTWHRARITNNRARCGSAQAGRPSHSLYRNPHHWWS